MSQMDGLQQKVKHMYEKKSNQVSITKKLEANLLSIVGANKKKPKKPDLSQGISNDLLRKQTVTLKAKRQKTLMKSFADRSRKEVNVEDISLSIEAESEER